MAKLKTYAVEVEVTRRVLVYVEARKPGGAAEKIQTEQGWNDATRYDDDAPMWFDAKTMKVIGVREAGL